MSVSGRIFFLQKNMTRKAMAIIVLIVCVISCSVVETSDSKPLKVFICAGQSNMLGAGSDVELLPPELQGKQPDVFFFQLDGRTWDPLEPERLGQHRFGPELSFVHAMSNALQEPVGIIKVGHGDSNLVDQWSSEVQDSLCFKVLRKIKVAQKTRAITVVGMIWMHGEADARDEAMAGLYGQHLLHFIDEVRQACQDPQMPFIAGRINPPTRTYLFTDVVRMAQETCPVPNYAFIDCDAFQKTEDGVSYNTVGLIEMGRAFSVAMLELMNQNEPFEKASSSVFSEKI